MVNDPVILIPCHVNNNHWVGIARRRIHDRVYFFYADDLTSGTTEQDIKHLIATETDTQFYPRNATWVQCPSTTFQPHSNECGPRTLLALAVIGLHPTPHANMLMPYMSANLSQILWMWVAATVLTGDFKFPHAFERASQTLSFIGQSSPSNLFQWRQVPLNSQPNKKPYLQSLRATPEPSPQGRQEHLHASTAPPVHVTPQPTQSTQVQLKQGKMKKHSRWKRGNDKKQSTIRTFLVTQPKLYDFKFFKPQKRVSAIDPDFWGHVMEPINPQKIFRLLLQNPNGIQPHFSYLDFLFSLHVCENIGISAMSLPETNLNWQPHHIASTKKCFKKTWEHSCIQYSHSEEEFESTYKPGGTLTAVTGPWTARVVEKGVDPYGLG
jgi:hypothetical protein